MTGPEGWQRARTNLGEALSNLEGQNREYQFAEARLSATADLVRESARLEAELELAKSQLDLASVRERRSRSNHDHANEIARRRGASPENLLPYIQDPSFVEAQSKYDAVKSEQDRVRGEIQEIERGLRVRFGL